MLYETREEATIQSLMGHINALEDTIKRQSETIKALEQAPILDKIRAEINKLTVYYTTKDKKINLISQNAVNRIIDKYKAESEEKE